MRRRLGLFCCTCLLLLLSVPIAGVDAYRTGGRWMANDNGYYANYVDYQVDPNLDFHLSEKSR